MRYITIVYHMFGVPVLVIHQLYTFQYYNTLIHQYTHVAHTLFMRYIVLLEHRGYTTSVTKAHTLVATNLVLSVLSFIMQPLDSQQLDNER